MKSSICASLHRVEFEPCEESALDSKCDALVVDLVQRGIQVICDQGRNSDDEGSESESESESESDA